MMSQPTLELAVDKFLFRFPSGLSYSAAGIWAEFEGRRVRVGLSDFTQQRNGDAAFIEMKGPGTRLRTGQEMGTVETIKVNVSLPAPVSGEVVEVNSELETAPELVNQDPYGKGWLAVLEVEDAVAARGRLLAAADFLAQARKEAASEVGR